ncbi:MAG TPA: putative colanic acid biosynthesis acetyltransferase [Kiritimatiellia bacterium]|nr:putative colanic acid biosynthesis acetyltransferase [Kiritimatiellia bacterium]
MTPPRDAQLDLSRFKSELSAGNRLARALWGIVWCCLFRPTPRPLHAWRRFLLRCFRARMGRGTRVYASARVWAPWNLTMGDFSVLGDYVDCYAVDRIEIGAHSVVSQYTFLCTATHDVDQAHFPLVTKPIRIGAHAWVAADVFVGPGVTVGEGAVVGARSSVFRDVEPQTIVAGNPARLIRRRRVEGQPAE